MAVVNLLAPIFLIIALGSGLHRAGMLPQPLVAGINKILYWIGLPAAVFYNLVIAEPATGGVGALLGVMAGATLINALLSWLEAPALGIAPGNRGTFVQAAFRGNLSFVALPLLLTVPGVPIGQTMLAFAPMLIVHNALAVLVLLASHHESGWRAWGPIGREILRNPIILAAVAGAIFQAMRWPVPMAITTTLGSLSKMSLPLALLCIGATLMSVPVRGNQRLAAVAAGHKVVLSPLIGYALGRWVGLSEPAMLALLLCLACPTAAISYTMVKQMGGDEGLAATSVVYASLGSAVSLAVVIALFVV